MQFADWLKNKMSILLKITCKKLCSCSHYTTDKDMINPTVNKCQRIPKGQSKMNNPEKLATLGTQGTSTKTNVNKTWVLLQTTGGKDEPNILNKTWTLLQTTGGKDEPNIRVYTEIIVGITRFTTRNWERKDTYRTTQKIWLHKKTRGELGFSRRANSSYFVMS